VVPQATQVYCLSSAMHSPSTSLFSRSLLISAYTRSHTPGILHDPRFSRSVFAKIRMPRTGAMPRDAYHSARPSLRTLLYVSIYGLVSFGPLRRLLVFNSICSARSPRPSRTKVPHTRASYRAACCRLLRTGGGPRD